MFTPHSLWARCVPGTTWVLVRSQDVGWRQITLQEGCWKWQTDLSFESWTSLSPPGVCGSSVSQANVPGRAEARSSYGGSACRVWQAASELPWESSPLCVGPLIQTACQIKVYLTVFRCVYIYIFYQYFHILRNHILILLVISMLNVHPSYSKTFNCPGFSFTHNSV